MSTRTNPRFLRAPFGIAVALALTASLAHGQNPEGRKFIGSVVDMNGKPVEGAVVEWGHFQAPPAERQRVETNADGMYELIPLEIGPDFRLGVAKTEYAPKWRDAIVPAREGTTIDFQLERRHWIAGVVVDEAGKPTRGASVTLLTAPSGYNSSFSSPIPPTPIPGVTLTATTNEDGAFELEGLPAGEVAIRLSHPDGTSSKDEVRLVDSKCRLVFPLPMKRISGTLRGRVVDDKGVAVGGGALTLRHRPNPYPISSVGTFEIADEIFTDRTYSATLFVPGYRPTVVPFNPREGTDVSAETIELQPSPALTIEITGPDDAPIAGAELIHVPADPPSYFEWRSWADYADGYGGLIQPQRATTDSNGVARLAALGPTGTVFVRAQGRARQIVRLKGDRVKDHRAKIVLPGESVVTGVIDRARFPQADLSVNAYVDVEGTHVDYGGVPVDEMGRYRLGELPEGTIYVTLRSSGVKHSSLNFGLRNRRVTLGASREIELTFREDEGNETHEGMASPFAIVSLSPTFSWDTTTIAMMADCDGRYRLTGLKPGDYSMTTSTHSSAMGSHIHQTSRVSVGSPASSGKPSE